MTFDEAVLAVARAVASAPLNMTVATYWARVTSLVVRTNDGVYAPMTVKEWREAVNKPEVVLTIAGRDDFGG